VFNADASEWQRRIEGAGMIEYIVEGIPRPQGSKRHLGNGIMIESSKHVKNWRAFARLKATIAMQGQQRINKPNAVRLIVQFGFDRPKKHSTTKGLRIDAPVYHTGSPDTDKLLRALLDSMTGVVFEDDSQVSVIDARKFYAKAAQTWVRVDAVSE
jgi:crossover junction endodeoxyribonuclease RusA